MDGFHWQQWTAMRDRFCSRVPALSPWPAHWPVCWCTWQGCPGPLQVKAQHYCSCKGPAACCYPPHLHFHTAWPDGDRVGSGIWTLEDKASNLQICFRISTNQLRRKLKSWGMGIWALVFTLKGTASKQLHPGGYLRHIINLCSQGYFPIQSRRTEVLESSEMQHITLTTVGVKGRAEPMVSLQASPSSLGILTHKAFQSFLPCLVMRALLKCVNLKHAAEKKILCDLTSMWNLKILNSQKQRVEYFLFCFVMFYGKCQRMR